MIVAFVLTAIQLSASAPPSVLITATNESPNIVFQPASATTATLTVQSGGLTRTIEVNSLDDALAILADKHLSAIWPKVTEWGGPGLERLRDSYVNAAQAIFEKGRTTDANTSLGSAVSPKLRGTVLLADALLNAGRIDEATRLMENARGTAPQKGRWGASEWAATSAWLAQAQYTQGNVETALSIIEDSMPVLENDRAILNLEVNRAAILLDIGRASEALSALEAVQAGFAAPGGDGPFTSNARLKGSDRHFAWIRSCALSKLGRLEEAAAAAAILDTGIEPQDKRFVIDPTIRIRTRWTRCIGNVNAAVRAYTSALSNEPFGGYALLELQPTLTQPSFDQSFFEKVRQSPALYPALADRWRPLPINLVPALNGWRMSRLPVADINFVN